MSGTELIPGALAEQNAMLQQIAAALDEGVLIFDGDGSCRLVGRRVAELFGLDVQILLGKQRTEVLAHIAAATEAPEQLSTSLDEESLTSGRTVVDPVVIARGRRRIVVWTSIPLQGLGANASRGRLDIVRDVTRERRAEANSAAMAKRLEEESEVDPLTGLPNARRFAFECEREHRRAQRAWDSYAVACVEVDDVSLLVERPGTGVEEHVLVRLGSMIRRTRREYDVVARYGSGYAMLLPGVDARATGTVIKRVIDGINVAPIEIEGEEVSVTVSAGAAVWTPPSGETSEDIARRAADALAAARKNGPGQTQVDAGSSFEFRDEDTDLS